jgi:hypothetical protein
MIISAYDEGGQWRAAEAAFKPMQAAGVTPNDHTNAMAKVTPSLRVADWWQ